MESAVINSKQNAVGQKIRIVIADDHPIFRDGLCRLLDTDSEFEIVGEATDGAGALRLVEERQPDVLLLDFQMPGMSGLETLRQLKRSAPGTRVLLLTAAEETDIYVEAVRCGSAGVVSKQAGPEQLFKSIRKVHQGEMWLDNDTMVAVLRRFREARPGAGGSDTPKGAGELTQREKEVILLLVQGLRNRDIADRMFLSEQTVKNHLNNIFEKLCVTDRLELALHAIHSGLFPNCAV